MLQLLLRALVVLVCLCFATSARAEGPAVLHEPEVIRAARAVTYTRPAEVEPPSAKALSREEKWAHVSFAIGGAGLVTAGATWIARKKMDREAACGARCPAKGREESSASKALSRTTMISTGVAVAGAVAGVTLLVVGKRGKRKRERQGLYAVAGPQLLGMKARF
jgi:hypothetical protein